MQKRINTARVQKLSDQGDENDLVSTTPAQRLAMMWQLALDSWAFKEDSLKGDSLAESRLQRHVVSIQRRES